MEALFGVLLLAAVGALITGAARFAVPGPDPMPFWLMSVIGIVSAILGGGIGYSIGGEVGALVASVFVATLIVIVYRRVVQRRGITGPAAQRMPTRGLGVKRTRRRGDVEAREPLSEQLRELGELRAQGLITDEEFAQKRAELLARI